MDQFPKICKALKQMLNLKQISSNGNSKVANHKGCLARRGRGFGKLKFGGIHLTERGTEMFKCNFIDMINM